MTALTCLALAAEQAAPMNQFITTPAEPIPIWETPLDWAMLTVLYVLPGLAFAIALSRKFPRWFLRIRTLLAVTFPLLFWLMCIHWLAYFLSPNPLTFYERACHMLKEPPPSNLWIAFTPSILLIVFLTLWDDRALRIKSKACRFSDIS